ncbi:TldD/PmbA family protein [candidate division CSSED10-310 bacterium]|uniref:TldD/PmbA family protein n=1 Tax=candidate division CSSED10-310 bacterium TaxID=2855610 RepID=A0ABV6Z2A0_UNCC1
MKKTDTSKAPWQELVNDCPLPTELFLHKNETLSLEFQDKKLKQINTKESNDSALRLINNNQIGFSAGAIGTPFPVLYQSAENVSRYGQKAYFQFTTGEGKPQVWSKIEPEITALTLENLIEYGHTLQERLCQEKPGYMVRVGLSKVNEAVHIITNSGLDRTYSRNSYGLSFSLEKTQEGDIIDYHFRFNHIPTNEELEEALQESFTSLDLCENVVSLPGGSYPVLFHPHSLATLLSPFQRALMASSVYNKSSPLKDKLEQQILSEKITFSDDPLWEQGIRQRPFDDEGVLSQTTTIVDKGILKSFLNNLDYAGRLNMKPNGNAARLGMFGKSTKFQPTMYFTNQIMMPGDDHLADMKKSITTGLLLDHSADCWQGANINGDFSGTVNLGFLIKNGSAVGRVKNMRLAGNIYQLFGPQLEGVSRERKTMNDVVLFPYLLSRDVALS